MKKRKGEAMVALSYTTLLKDEIPDSVIKNIELKNINIIKCISTPKGFFLEMKIPSGFDRRVDAIIEGSFIEFKITDFLFPINNFKNIVEENINILKLISVELSGLINAKEGRYKADIKISKLPLKQVVFEDKDTLKINKSVCKFLKKLNQKKTHI